MIQWEMDPVADLIALIALGFSIFVWYRQRKLESERKIRDEFREKAAYIVVRRTADRYTKEIFGRRDSRVDHAFVLENVGRARATNIRLLINGKPFHEHKSAGRREPATFTLDPAATVKLGWLPFLTSVPVKEIKVIWDDGLGRNREFISGQAEGEILQDTDEVASNGDPSN